MNNQKKIKSLFLSVNFVIVFIIILILLSQIKHFIPEQFERFSHGIIGTFTALITAWIFLKYEKISFNEIGLKWDKNTIKKFATGLILGIVLVILMIYSQVTYSGLEITLSDNYDITSFLIWSSAFIPLAFMEEIAFRSYPFIKLNRVFGLRITQIIIAVLFALYHVVNGWSIGLSFIGPGVWALAFGLSAVISDGVSMPTGLHYGANLVLASISGKKGVEGIWTIDFPNEVSETVLKANENFRIGIHLVLLILCLIGAELYLRKKKTTANNVYKKYVRHNLNQLSK